MRYILHGSNDADTDNAMKLLDKAEIPYRLEMDKTEIVTLVGFGGRYTGLLQIHQAFGSGSLEDLTIAA